MKTVLTSMKRRGSGIPEEVLPVFEQIVQVYRGNEREAEFMKAMETCLSTEQRYRLFERHGSCNGTAQDAARKAFAREHADMPLGDRLALFAATHGRTAVLNDDNTITVTFKCRHGYYKHTPTGTFPFPETVGTYFERCAGGRLYEYERVLGVKLRIKAVDVTPLETDPASPVVFTFEVLG